MDVDSIVSGHTGLYTQDDFDDGDNDAMEEKGENAVASSQTKESGTVDNGINNDDGENNDNGNDNDDDGESSVDSFSSSQSGTSLSSMGSTSSEVSLTLMQRQARNIARNERFLGSLREKYEGQLGTTTTPHHPNSKRKGAAFLKKKTMKGETTSATSDWDDDADDNPHMVEENLGMVMKGTHRLFRFSPTREMSGIVNDPNSDRNNEYETLMRAYQNHACGIKTLERIYPHRRVQIGKLHAILSATVSLTASIPSVIVSSSAASVYVPAPIFCMGSKGTGKTSVVCDVVGLLASREANDSPSLTVSAQPAVKVQPAYVDCSIVEPSTIERLVYTIYKQLKPSPSSSSILPEEKKSSKSRSSSKPKQHKKKKRKRPGTSFHLPPKAPQLLEIDAHAVNSSSLPPTPIKLQHKQYPRENEYEANQPRVLPSRRAKKAAINKSLANNATTYQNVKKNRIVGNNNDTSDEEESDSDEEAVATLHSAVLSLGRSLQKHYGSLVDDNGAYRNRGFCKKPKCGILVLDRAEELLSLSSTSKKGTSSANSGGANNYLSELLLLPKIMKLNLTIVVVTNYCTLHMTRLNNAADPSKALGTISNGVHPIIVQFPAYKGNKVFSEILSTPDNQKLVMGDSLSSSPPTNAVSTMHQSFKDKLIRSFWNTVVQFASDSTRDIRDFQRLGRTLWPSFVAPLHPSVLKTTLKAASNKLGFGGGGLTKGALSDPLRYTKIEDEVVRLLGNKFYLMVASLASGDDSLTLLTLDEDGTLPVCLPSSSAEDGACGRIEHDPNIGSTFFVPQPYLRNCLLLAAFVCQHNKADQDRKLFSVQGNGKRRRSKAKEDIYGGNDEDLAFGSTSATQSSRGRGRRPKQDGQQPRQVEQLRSLKLRPIPLERVFSIFVTLVRLNPNNGRMNNTLGLGGGDDEADLEATMDDLGSSRLYTDLSHLIDLGYLHLLKENQQSLQSTTARILCSLTREEALEISNRIGIPLERYLL